MIASSLTCFEKDATTDGLMRPARARPNRLTLYNPLCFMDKCPAVTVDLQVQPILTPLVSFIRLTRFQGFDILIQGPQMPTATDSERLVPYFVSSAEQGIKWQEVPLGKLAGRV
jgi:hypothetical protein